MKLSDCNSGDFIWIQVSGTQTLQQLATQHSTDIVNIIRNNPNIDLYDGEMVKIVRKTKAYHIVKPMETLSIIASKYNTDEDTLIRINNLNSRRLFIGQNLKIDND